MTSSDSQPAARAAAVLATALVSCAVLTACGSNEPTTTPGDRGSAPAPPEATSFATQHLGVPLDLRLPDWVDPKAEQDTAHFVTFHGKDSDLAVRVLLPADVFFPGSTTRGPVPADYEDYVAYLQGQEKDGAHLDDRTTTTVDGHDTTVMTATSDRELNGSLGCQSDTTPADECFGLQPEYLLRIAVVDTDHGPLLIWLRDSSDVPDAERRKDSSRLDDLLAGVRFADRTAQADPAPSALEGVFTALGTSDRADALGVPDQCPGTPGRRFTLELHEGQFVEREGCDGAASEVGSLGTYRTDGDSLVLYESCCGASVLDFTLRGDALTLHWHDRPSDPMAVFVYEHRWARTR